MSKAQESDTRQATGAANGRAGAQPRKLTTIILDDVVVTVPKKSGPLLVVGGIAILAGHPGGGKSWLAWDIALALASGQQYLGSVDVEQMNVLYLCVDQTPGEFKGEKAGLLMPPRNISALGVRFQCFDGIKDGIDLSDEADRQALRAKCKDECTGLLVIDSLSPALGAADTNDEKSTRPIYRFLRELNEEGITVLVLQHLNKGNGQGLEKLRGSLNIAAEAHVVAGVSIKDSVIEIVFWKYRISKTPDPISVRLAEVKGGIGLACLDPDEIVIGQDGKATKAERFIAQWIEDNPTGSGRKCLEELKKDKTRSVGSDKFQKMWTTLKGDA